MSEDNYVWMRVPDEWMGAKMSHIKTNISEWLEEKLEEGYICIMANIVDTEWLFLKVRDKTTEGNKNKE